MALSAHGIRLDVPPGWEGRIYRRADAGSQPVMHAASIPLVPGDGDFATGTAAQLPIDGALMVLCEYDPALAGTGMFDHRPPRAFDPAEASPNHLLRRIPGQAGYQRFFTESGRAFGLYVVVGSHVRPGAVVLPHVNTVLGSLAISARS
jgi:hypothetical protein